MSKTSRCRNGHEKTPENTFTAKDGRPRCYVCKLASNTRAAARMARNRNQQPPDGLEALYGPVPPREARLVDWVQEAREAAEKAPQPRERVSKPLRSSAEGHLGSKYQPPGKRRVVVLAARG